MKLPLKSGAATVEFEFAGVATFDAVLDLTGATTLDVEVVFELAVDVPRHIPLPNVSGV
ncbi:hypothetical protein [Glaciimonas sp. PCH181]|uniref:hypothetical protein n=1 Tax=Glaciimonas sp. PCH181 TaxID=2133943 RepID=UPI0013749C64|nr:hypothetical protein [Glaciimonas sp. PCH181]